VAIDIYQEAENKWQKDDSVLNLDQLENDKVLKQRALLVSNFI